VGAAQTNQVDARSALTATVSNLLTGTTYFFTATAYNADGVESEPCNTVTYTPTNTLIPASVSWPTPEPIVYGMSLGAGQLNATSGVAGTFVYDPPAGTILNAGSAQVLSVGFAPFDTTSYSPASIQVSLDVLKGNLTLTANDTNKLYGAALPALTASYSGFVNGDTPAALSSLPSLATTATAAGGAGTYPITASGAVASNYAISYVSGTLTILPTQVVPTSPHSVTLAWDPSPDADVTGYNLYYGVVGAAQTNRVDAGAALTSTVSNLLAGTTYFFTATAYNADGVESEPCNTVTYTPTTTAMPAPLAWGPPTPIEYGTSLGASQLNATSEVAGTFVYDPRPGTVLNADPAQVLSVRFTPLDSTNCAPSTTTVSLDVLRRNLTIVANDASKLYGAALPALTASYSGFVNGDTSAALRSLPSLATTATAASVAGTYPITASGAVASNYAISYLPGTLSVLAVPNQAPSVTLTAPANGASYEASASVTLTATASDADGTIAKVEFFQGSTKLGEGTASPYSLVWTNVAAGSYSLTAVATDNLGTNTVSASVATTFTNSLALPPPWTTNKIGTILANCTATQSNGTFILKSGGSQIASTSDNFWFVHQPASTNFVLTARVVSQSASGSAAGAGLMIRESASISSRHVFMGLAPATRSAQWVRRTSTGGNSSTTTVNRRAAPYWVRLARTGTTLTGSISPEGAIWTKVASASISLPASVLAGLALCSGSSSATNTAVFDNVTLAYTGVPMAPSPVPPSLPPAASAVIADFAASAEASTFVITGEEGTGWQLEASSDLDNWEPLQTLTILEGVARHSEGATTAPARFFRLLQVR